MALPAVPTGWITDYYTAREVFLSGDAALRAAVRSMCAAGAMKFCACEEPSFKNNPKVQKAFLRRPKLPVQP